MGLYDTILLLDRVAALCCAQGHPLRSFQTKDFDEPSMCTYLVRDGRLYRTDPADAESHWGHASESWRLEGNEAVHEHRFTLREVRGPLTVNAYGNCRACDPLLARTVPGLFGDIVNEHGIFADFRLTFRPEEPVCVQRTSGTRDELKHELRTRGVYVLEDDEPLALAHREIQKARLRPDANARRRGPRF